MGTAADLPTGPRRETMVVDSGLGRERGGEARGGVDGGACRSLHGKRRARDRGPVRWPAGLAERVGGGAGRAGARGLLEPAGPADLGLARGRNPLPFGEDDATLALDLASRAAVSIDHARWYQNQRRAAENFQRSLLPRKPSQRPGLDIACRYQPASTICGIGGDWYDAIALSDDRTALVIGDVMGSGSGAAAAMGQLRTATRTLAALDLDPAAVLWHLDRITGELEQRFATCTYAVYDPRRACCHVAVAGHLPPVLIPAGGAPRLLDLPTGAPLGVGSVPFETTRLRIEPGDGLLLYTDGLVETRSHSLDAQLATLLGLLARPPGPLEETCDHLLDALRSPDEPDDVALLLTRAGRT
ncbi:PP2C family protein-serine/threonine phosphatase [Streptomyces sp. NPDC001292]|uniref:PP2C family protein-serine/threonine phosphatase n=1 Tax=Streptomyces sp. NPDC001292 TaxID=3364558 RepID=UPI003686E6AC